MSAFATRDCRLVGPENEKAVAAVLASAKWYSLRGSRAEFKELVRREDSPAIRHTLIWFAGLIVTGALAAPERPAMAAKTRGA